MFSWCMYAAGVESTLPQQPAESNSRKWQGGFFLVPYLNRKVPEGWPPRGKLRGGCLLGCCVEKSMRNRRGWKRKLWRLQGNLQAKVQHVDGDYDASLAPSGICPW